MRIGLSSALEHETPEEWALRMQELGCRSVVFPVDYTAPENVIADYADAAHSHDLMIAEVGIWRNVFAIDPKEQREARQRAAGQLKLADEIGAKCCVNVAGTYGGPLWDGGYKTNYSKECWDMIRDYTRGLLDEVKPARTKYSLEAMPWMYPSSPDEYLKMLEEVDRPAFGVHMDVVNMINCPGRYFFSDDFLQECFDKLGKFICSCHLKDIRLKTEYTFQLEETYCGNGSLNIEKYISLIDQYDKDMPVIIEHLDTDEEYISSLNYVKERLKRADLL
ncbi:sugar phosphate isomerase/epimerase family protein [Murimonas intestini]|uniref:Sugar phosphate isomerase/epimerase n=1 Tax=Murimonas intestini TaxID=1337051 RepID=A0AB73T9Q0_9FIRM|nr:sugar phosphate isomerase/epimerase [Murimonas intestini]MCR1839284.1 sugar phosphate isomerase/epimerase [Murimonas intestini]MCR1864579.1 sugar phosphate isomerase/epimerase [Murimonas intestini]MCR1882189.1 sugar phosphate isomerase/epimerase [Murimonas intestini]